MRPPRVASTLLLDGRSVDAFCVTFWCERFFWRERCAEYDAYIDRIRIEERKKLLEQSQPEIIADFLTYTAVQRELAIREALKWLAQSKASGAPVFKVSELIKLAATTQNMDQLARGLPTMIEKTTFDVSAVSTDDLAAARKLLGLPE
jgi:hypothetical protein